MRSGKEWAVHFLAQRYLEAKMDPAQFLMNERDDPWDLLANGHLQKAVRIRDFMLGRGRLIPDPTDTLRQVSERFVAAVQPLNRSVTIVAILHAEAVASVRMWQSDKGTSDFAYPRGGYKTTRCVRADNNGAYFTPVFTDNGDGTITEAVASLMRLQPVPPQKYDWEVAIQYCEDLEFAGHSDWKQPSNKEMTSKTDYTRMKPALDTVFFPETDWKSHYWTRTNETRDAGRNLMSEVTIQPEETDDDVNNANENAFAHSYMLGGNWRAPRVSGIGTLRPVGAMMRAPGSLSRCFAIGLAATMSSGRVTLQDLDALGFQMDSTEGALKAAEANLNVIQTRINTVLPAERDSAVAKLDEAEAQLAKMTVYADIPGALEQFLLQPGDIVNPILRPAGILVPSEVGRERFQAGFRQIAAPVIKVGMIAEIACSSQPFTVIPMVVVEVQDVLPSGQFRHGDRLIDPQDLVRPGTVFATLAPLYEGQAEGISPGSKCLANAYTNNHDLIASGDLGTLGVVYNHMVDALSIVPAILLRVQAVVLPVQILVLSGH